MLSRSEHERARTFDYFFAQVAVKERLVDFRPTCGNILSGVGPAAIEMGLVEATDPETTIRIHAVNTGALIEAVIQTPGGQVRYDGDTEIAGVPGSGAAIRLNFMDVVGSSTGALLPTGQVRDLIDGVEVTCMDVAMPIAIASAEAFGLTGYETSELEPTRIFMRAWNRSASRQWGIHQVGDPEIRDHAPRDGSPRAISCPGTATPRWRAVHRACGSLRHGGRRRGHQIRRSSDRAPLRTDQGRSIGYQDGFALRSAGLIRTARLLVKGEIMVPGALGRLRTTDVGTTDIRVEAVDHRRNSHREGAASSRPWRRQGEILHQLDGTPALFASLRCESEPGNCRFASQMLPDANRHKLLKKLGRATGIEPATSRATI